MEPANKIAYKVIIAGSRNFNDYEKLKTYCDFYLIMGKLLNQLKEYFENTPKEVLEKEAKELEYLNEIGPDVLEYAKLVRGYINKEEEKSHE